jgi:hypothetical protein
MSSQSNFRVFSEGCSRIVEECLEPNPLQLKEVFSECRSLNSRIKDFSKDFSRATHSKQALDFLALSHRINKDSKLVTSSLVFSLLALDRIKTKGVYLEHLKTIPCL